MKYWTQCVIFFVPSITSWLFSPKPICVTVRVLIFWNITTLQAVENQLMFWSSPTSFLLHACFLLWFLFGLEDGSGTFLQIQGNFQQTTQCYIPENRIIHEHHCVNLKSWISLLHNTKWLEGFLPYFSLILKLCNTKWCDVYRKLVENKFWVLKKLLFYFLGDSQSEYHISVSKELNTKSLLMRSSKQLFSLIYYKQSRHLIAILISLT